MERTQQQAPVLANERVQGDYFRIYLAAPSVASLVAPGQFVHLQLPDFEHHVLRRPFSVCDAVPGSGVLTVVYKVVGEGTAHMARLGTDDVVDVMGPLGRGFTAAAAGRRAVIVAGGYGCAATYMHARRSGPGTVVLIGGRSSGDILLADEFRALGVDLRIATDDGSVGHHGVVTGLLEAVLAEEPAARIAACGPNPMLRAVARIADAHGVDAEVSLDHAMCCGVGACFACVMKMKADNEDGWEYVRTCMEGPVFPSARVYWDDERDETTTER